MVNRFSPIGGEFLICDTPPAPFTPEDFDPVRRQLGEAADRFLREQVLPWTDRIDAGDWALTDQLMRRAGEAGLLAADVPACYGGLGLDIPAAALIAEKLNPQQSFALSHEAHTVIATLPLLYFGTHEQKARCLPKLASGEWIGSFGLSEADSGSDALAMRTEARRDASGTWRLRGMKTWITNTGFADLFTIFARCEGRIDAFLVPRESPGMTFGPEERKLGMRGTSTRRIFLDEVAVPDENALPHGTGHYAALCALNLGRFKLEAGAVGGLKELMGQCVRYTEGRRAFGRPLADNGLVLHRLAEMAARVYALESMVYRLAGLLERVFAGVVADGPDASGRYHAAAEEYALECNLVKVIGSEAYSELSDEAIQLHGGYGYTENFPVARTWRDQRLLRIGEGANEVVRVAIVRQLLRRDQAGRLPVLSAPLPDDPARRLALLVLRAATEALGQDGLIEAQEVAAPIADAIGAAYALESVALRVAKSCHDPRHAALGAAAGLGHRETLARSARTALANLSVSPIGEMGALVEFFSAPLENPMRLRRGVAGLVRDAGGWPLQ